MKKIIGADKIVFGRYFPILSILLKALNVILQTIILLILLVVSLLVFPEQSSISIHGYANFEVVEVLFVWFFCFGMVAGLIVLYRNNWILTNKNNKEIFNYIVATVNDFDIQKNQTDS